MQVTTITLFKYETLKQKAWAFGMMQFAHSDLMKTKGLEFYKLLGSGRGNGFNPYPDWSTYALLQVWSDENDANDFFSESELFGRYKKNSKSQWTIYMKSIVAKGEWSGGNPFKNAPIDPTNSLLAIITRATIRLSKLRTFWKYVPTSERPLEKNEGLIFTKGIGEVPAIQMATFSIWKDEASLKAFAYKSQEHQKAIQMTRDLDWYSEEMFARFQPYKTLGSWDGEEKLSMLS